MRAGAAGVLKIIRTIEDNGRARLDYVDVETFRDCGLNQFRRFKAVQLRGADGDERHSGH